MDAKAILRSRMREATQKRRKIIDSPLVRYNDLGQPVCKVCNVTVKSETLWTAHLSSRQHKTTVDELKARAAILAPRPSEPPINQVDTPVVKGNQHSALPADFFDVPKTGVQINSTNLPLPGKDDSKVPLPGKDHTKPPLPRKGYTKPPLPGKDHTKLVVVPEVSSGSKVVNVKLPTQTVTQDGKQIPSTKGALPEGFFDNQDADSRARGLEPVKLDIQDEYKEFKKSIEEDVQDVDVRLEDEEFEAAEEREEHEQITQRGILERIELLKKKQREKAAASATTKDIRPNLKRSADEESSDDESDDEDNLFVDWRAKHI